MKKKFEPYTACANYLADKDFNSQEREIATKAYLEAYTRLFKELETEYQVKVIGPKELFLIQSFAKEVFTALPAKTSVDYQTSLLLSAFGGLERFLGHSGTQPTFTVDIPLETNIEPLED